MNKLIDAPKASIINTAVEEYARQKYIDIDCF